MTDTASLDQARDWFASAQRIVALTGAGISTDSGIPDFRGPQGVWTRNPTAEKQSDIRYYMADPAVRAQAWQARLTHPVWSARPNAGHQALVTLEQRGRLLALVTQNIDGMHQIAGNSDDRVLEVHGNLRRVVCMACGLRTPMPDVLERVRAGEVDPPCLACGGIQKSDTVSFGQPLPTDVFARAQVAAEQAELFVALGTTLQVYPVAGLVPLAREGGARIVIINAEPTAMDDLADQVFYEPISTLLPQLVA